MTEGLLPDNSLDDLKAGSLHDEQMGEESGDDAPTEISSKMTSDDFANGLKENESDDEEAKIIAKAKGML